MSMMAEEEQPLPSQPQSRWNKRPESTIAQNFAADLDAMFGLSPEIEALNSSVESKKQTVTTSSRELEALEARLRETEQRLSRISRNNSPSRPDDTTSHAPPLPTSRPPPPPIPSSSSAAPKSPLAQKPTFPADRPATADRPRTGRAEARGVMTGMGSSEYVVVDRTAGTAQPGYG